MLTETMRAAPPYLGPGLSSAVLGLRGCARSWSCGSRIPVFPTALWGHISVLVSH